MESNGRRSRHGLRIAPLLSFVVATCAAFAVGAVAVTPVLAATPTCVVRNMRSTATLRGSGVALKLSLTGAQAGDTLRIEGICAGSFTLARNVTLLGRATALTPHATLDGNKSTRVLTIASGVSANIRNLTITDGYTISPGSAILNRGSLTLQGTSSVTHSVENRCWGGAIYNNGGTLVLEDSARVRANNGGAINNSGALTIDGTSSVSETVGCTPAVVNTGTAVMNGSASVSHNQTGGIENDPGATLTLNDLATIGSNTNQTSAGYPVSGGGGVANGGTVAMHDDSRVRGNWAYGLAGGGIANVGTVTMDGAAAISDNRSTMDGGGVSDSGTLSLSGTAPSMVTVPTFAIPPPARP